MILKTGAIIVAAGSSTRFGKDKIFIKLGNKPLLAWAIDVFQSFMPVNQIVVVLNKENLHKGQILREQYGWNKVSDFCLGAERRQDSVKEGLKQLSGCDWVVIHDGARPFLTTDLLKKGLKAAEETGAAIAAIPVKDTIKLSDNDFMVKKTLVRNNLWAIQTPQIFRFDIISEAYKKIEEDVTDDAALVENIGYKVKLYVGSFRNIKITTPEDLALAKLLLKANKG